MITATERPEAGHWPGADESTTLGPILVATDGTKSAESALRAAATMARHAEAEVVVLSVLEGLPLIAGDYGMIIPPIDADETRRQALLKRVPAEFLKDAHHWLILHGRYTCKARRPECWRCPIRDVCRFKEKTENFDER